MPKKGQSWEFFNSSLSDYIFLLAAFLEKECRQVVEKLFEEYFYEKKSFVSNLRKRVPSFFLIFSEFRLALSKKIFCYTLKNTLKDCLLSIDQKRDLTNGAECDIGFQYFLLSFKIC